MYCSLKVLLTSIANTVFCSFVFILIREISIECLVIGCAVLAQLGPVDHACSPIEGAGKLPLLRGLELFKLVLKFFGFYKFHQCEVPWTTTTYL